MDSSTRNNTRAAGDSGELQGGIRQTVDQFISRAVGVELEEAEACLRRAKRMSQELPQSEVPAHLDTAQDATLDALALIREGVSGVEARWPVGTPVAASNGRRGKVIDHVIHAFDPMNEERLRVTLEATGDFPETTADYHPACLRRVEASHCEACHGAGGEPDVGVTCQACDGTGQEAQS